MHKTRRWLGIVGLGLAAFLGWASAQAGEPGPAVKFEIPSQPLRQALNEFGQQSGLQVAFLYSEISDQIVAPRVVGSYSPQVALAQLLANTSLEFKFLNDRTVTVRAGKTEEGGRPQARVGEEMAWRVAQTEESSASGKQTEQAGVMEGTKLEEIVVTAQKRQENLQQVPISAQVISGKTLNELNHNTLADLTQTVPAVFVSNSNAFSNDVFIRGIGSGQNPAFDQSVSMFTDDIYHGRSRMSGVTFLDLDRIEVLKGPQSTFFGNNAIAGAFNIVTKKPGDHFEAGASALYGEFNQYKLEGAAGGPVTDTFGARVALISDGMRGWIRNVSTGHEAPTINNLGGRLTLVYAPIENLDATLKIEGSRHRTSGSSSETPSQWNNCPPPAPIPSGFGNSCDQVLALGVPTGLDNNLMTGLPGVGNSLSTFEDVLTINYHRGGQTFTSVSGFYNYHFDARGDSGLPVNTVFTSSLPEKYHQFSQEFRVASPTGAAVEYLAGVYFQTDQLAWDKDVNAPILTPLLTAFFPQFVPYLPLAQDIYFSQGEHVYSAFGSLSWNVTDRLKLSGSLRASQVTKDFIGHALYGTGTQTYGGFVLFPTTPGSCGFPAGCEALGGALFGGAGTSESLSRSDRAWMPSARVQYQLDRDAMVYFRYDRGFKAGGYNGVQPFTTIPGNTDFGPEHVNAYELGLKSTWFDDRLLLNLDVFRSDYKDLQVLAVIYNPVTNTAFGGVRNAAASKSQGVEFESQWAVTKDFRLGANVTYLDAHYGSYPNAPATTLQNFCGTLSQAQYSATPQCARFSFPVQTQFRNLSGQPTSYAPKWSGSVTASYSMLLPGAYKFTTGLSPYFTSSYNPDPDGLYPALGSYVRLDAGLTLEKPDRHWALDLIGKNLTNRIILTTLSTKEQPRNVALQFRYQY